MHRRQRRTVRDRRREPRRPRKRAFDEPDRKTHSESDSMALPHRPQLDMCYYGTLQGFEGRRIRPEKQVATLARRILGAGDRKPPRLQ